MTAARLTIGITTRDRPLALERCLRSLSLVSHLAPEVLVFDDTSTTPARDQIDGWSLPISVRVIRNETRIGMIVGRNRLVREASAPAVLLMDDDAALRDAGAIEAALRVLDDDRQVGVIAFAQCDLAGTKWDEAMQPARSAVPCYVAAFIGFSHLVRRETFSALGGYREALGFYGEEKEFSIRLIDAGYRTVYLPAALVIHAPDPAGRSQQRYLRSVTKNDCLTALFNQPLSRALWLVPARFFLYFRMRRAWRIEDPWGWAWILGELWRHAGTVWRDRKPVSRATVATWKRLQAHPEPYVLRTPNPEPRT
jgi:GT2 family glycosyltransferase